MERKAKVYLSEELKKYIVPTEMRDVSFNEGTTFTPGSRISLDKEAKYIRLFCAWTGKNNEATHHDIDLSAGIVRDGVFDRISFYSQDGDFAVHSGDYTSCQEFNPKDGMITAEYIDIDVSKAKEYFRNAKEGYVIIANNIFSGANNFSGLNSWVGVQLLDGRVSKKSAINLNKSLFKIKMGSKDNQRFHIGLGYDVKNDDIVMIDLYEDGHGGSTIDSISSKMDMYKQNFFGAIDYKENMFSIMKMFCKVNDYELTEEIDCADVICHYTDVEDLKDTQEMFNISNNLEKIVGMLQ